MPFTSLAVALIIVVFIAWLANSRTGIAEGNRRILNLVLGLIVVGILLWLINTYVPMAGVIKAILNIVVVIAVCIRVLQVFGLWGAIVQMWNELTHHANAALHSSSGRQTHADDSQKS
jgi:predicted membrane protein